MMSKEEPSQLPALRGARVRQIIEVEFNHGAGTEDDPIRRVYAYYDTEHSDVLLAWSDSSDKPRRIDPSFLASAWRG